MEANENKKWDKIWNVMYEVNEINGINQIISKLDTEQIVYDHCLNYNVHLNSCMVFGSMETDSCDSSCNFFEESED